MFGFVFTRRVFPRVGDRADHTSHIGHSTPPVSNTSVTVLRGGVRGENAYAFAIEYTMCAACDSHCA
jgi:hypothetical protein